MIKRVWDSNIGLFITFTIVIVIGVAVFGLIAAKYADQTKKNLILSILSNPRSDIKEFWAIGLCKTSLWASITYNPIKDSYTLKCERKLGLNISTLNGILAIDIKQGCSSTDTYCVYKIRK